MGNADTNPPRPVFVIEPSPPWRLVSARDIAEYRDLLYFLVWRDIKVRYKQTVLGAAWAVLQPSMTMVVFAIFFGHLAKLPSDGFPYPVFAYCALVPWQFFANALVQSSNSVVTNQSLIKKVYFPRLLIPLAAVIEQAVDFCIAFTLLVAMIFYYRIPVSLRLLAVPLFATLAALTAFSFGLWFSALNALYRDVRYTIGFAVQLWMFATPVAYSINLVPLRWRTLYALNPMTGVIDGFRWSILGSAVAPGPVLLVSIGAVLVILVGGLFYFRRVERSLADVL
jgi:lipopolysaccharide transport system permease protein